MLVFDFFVTVLAEIEIITGITMVHVGRVAFAGVAGEDDGLLPLGVEGVCEAHGGVLGPPETGELPMLVPRPRQERVPPVHQFRGDQRVRVIDVPERGR
jgi:hypothetical protein